MKMMPVQIRLNIGKIFLTGVFYSVFSVFLVFMTYGTLTSPFSLGPSELFDFNFQLRNNLVIGFLSGIFVGTTLVFVNGHQFFRNRPFRFSILITLLSYTLMFVVVLFANVAIIENFWRGANASLAEMAELYMLRISNVSIITYYILYGFVTLSTLFFLQVNDKFGPGILIKFLMGRYHRPRNEQRVFMFLDLRSSTSIAEQIGHYEYFNLLRDLFADITDTILNHGGEIYQYVGDEIVISWSMDSGMDDANCIRCFWEIERILLKNSGDYSHKYGCIPEFKAGVHYGQVTAGEVGVIKKDIVYSGDVLNTAARIQSLCNTRKVNLLVSEQLFSSLEHDGTISMTSLGEIELRGKKEPVRLGTLQPV